MEKNYTGTFHDYNIRITKPLAEFIAQLWGGDEKSKDVKIVRKGKKKKWNTNVKWMDI